MTYQQWHKAFGHPSPEYLRDNNYSDTSTIPKVPKDWQCETCVISKSTKRKPMLTPPEEHCKNPQDVIYCDLSGKFLKESFGKSNYYVTFIDDCTRYACVYPIHAKSDTVKAFADFIRERQVHNQAVIKRVRTDNGGEYVNAEMLKVLTRFGIKHDHTPRILMNLMAQPNGTIVPLLQQLTLCWLAYLQLYRLKPSQPPSIFGIDSLTDSQENPPRMNLSTTRSGRSIIYAPTGPKFSFIYQRRKDKLERN